MVSPPPYSPVISFDLHTADVFISNHNRCAVFTCHITLPIRDRHVISLKCTELIHNPKRGF